MFAATHTCLRALAEREPVVIAIDDVQWIDPPSAAALSYAIRRLADTRVSILAARRVEQATTDRSDFENALEHRHGQGLQRVEVGPVSADVLHAAILDRLGLAYPHSIVERIHQASGGNPFYALEIARALGAGIPRHASRARPCPCRTRSSSSSDRAWTTCRRRRATCSTWWPCSRDPSLARLTRPGFVARSRMPFSAGVLEITDEERARFSHPLLASAASAPSRPTHAARCTCAWPTCVDGEERARHLALGAEGPSAEAALALERGGARGSRHAERSGRPPSWPSRRCA